MGGRASAASKNAWNARNYDRINLTVPKGQKETIKNHAEARGESVNGFINRAIDTVIQQSAMVLSRGKFTFRMNRSVSEKRRNKPDLCGGHSE